jgi:multiple sugar transport system permease protein
VFLMRQAALQSVPRELLSAARMDGASEWRVFWSVVLPLLRPALGTLALITFIASWNNFMAPLVVMRAVENYTLPLALRVKAPTTPSGAP